MARQCPPDILSQPTPKTIKLNLTSWLRLVIQSRNYPLGGNTEEPALLWVRCFGQPALPPGDFGIGLQAFGVGTGLRIKAELAA